VLGRRAKHGLGPVQGQLVNLAELNPIPGKPAFLLLLKTLRARIDFAEAEQPKRLEINFRQDSRADPLFPTHAAATAAAASRTTITRRTIRFLIFGCDRRRARRQFEQISAPRLCPSLICTLANRH
jgi:hypothetical protein